MEKEEDEEEEEKHQPATKRAKTLTGKPAPVRRGGRKSKRAKASDVDLDDDETNFRVLGNDEAPLDDNSFRYRSAALQVDFVPLVRSRSSSSHSQHHHQHPNDQSSTSSTSTATATATATNIIRRDQLKIHEDGRTIW